MQLKPGQTIEVFDRGVLDGGSLCHARVGDENVESVADDAANLLRQFMGAVGRAEIGTDGVGTAAKFADFGGDAIGLHGAAGIVDQHLRAGFGQRQRRSAADAARSAGDERGFAFEIGHDCSPFSEWRPPLVNALPLRYRL